jgi:glycosyltransferase involved in cell wall biosynthesis
LSKIKVLHISPNGELYGTERHILSIVKYANRDIFEHWVATPVSGNFNAILDKYGVKNVIAGRMPNKKNKLAGMLESSGVRKLINLFRKEKFEIIHTHLNSYGGFLAGIFTRSKLVHTRHGVFWAEPELKNLSFLTKSFQKLKSRRFELTIAVGEYERDTMIKYFGYNPEKIRLTYNGVNVEEIQNKVCNFNIRSSLVNNQELLIGAVGRLERQKGFDMFIKAAAIVNKQFENVKFCIIGDGSLYNELYNLKESLGLGNNFQFIGYKENIYDYINTFDVMVQTSLWEGISYVVQEAMALKKPVIALTSKNVSGIKEIIIHEKTGFLIENSFVEKLSSSMIKLITDNSLINKMGESGLQRVKNDFKEERTCKDMEKYYLELINTGV